MYLTCFKDSLPILSDSYQVIFASKLSYGCWHKPLPYADLGLFAHCGTVVPPRGFTGRRGRRPLRKGGDVFVSRYACAGSRVRGRLIAVPTACDRLFPDSLPVLFEPREQTEILWRQNYVNKVMENKLFTTDFRQPSASTTCTRTGLWSEFSKPSSRVSTFLSSTLGERMSPSIT